MVLVNTILIREQLRILLLYHGHLILPFFKKRIITFKLTFILKIRLLPMTVSRWSVWLSNWAKLLAVLERWSEYSPVVLIDVAIVGLGFWSWRRLIEWNWLLMVDCWIFFFSILNDIIWWLRNRPSIIDIVVGTLHIEVLSFHECYRLLHNFT